MTKSIEVTDKTYDQLIELAEREFRLPWAEVTFLIQQQRELLGMRDDWAVKQQPDPVVMGWEAQKPLAKRKVGRPKKVRENPIEDAPVNRYKKPGTNTGYKWTPEQKKRLSERMKLFHALRKLARKHPSMKQELAQVAVPSKKAK